jgi:hypothetical protein
MITLKEQGNLTSELQTLFQFIFRSSLALAWLQTLDSSYEKVKDKTVTLNL